MDISKEVRGRAHEVAATAARLIDADKDGKLTPGDAKKKAAAMLGIAAAWVDAHDDFIEKPFQKAMRAVAVSKWPGYKYWGWLIRWYWLTLALLIAILVAAWLWAPRPALPSAALASLPGGLQSIEARLSDLALRQAQIQAQLVELNEQASKITRLIETAKNMPPEKRKSWARQFFGAIE